MMVKVIVTIRKINLAARKIPFNPRQTPLHVTSVPTGAGETSEFDWDHQRADILERSIMHQFLHALILSCTLLRGDAAPTGLTFSPDATTINWPSTNNQQTLYHVQPSTIHQHTSDSASVTSVHRHAITPSTTSQHTEKSLTLYYMTPLPIPELSNQESVQTHDRTLQENYPPNLRSNPIQVGEHTSLAPEPEPEPLQVNWQSEFPTNQRNGTAHRYEEEEERERAKSAHYSFGSWFQNGIEDNAFSRSERRNGLKLEGSYSYSDGYYKRTVNYVADENGYRVVKENVEAIGNGPVENEHGRVVVENSDQGGTYGYSITADDYKRRVAVRRRPVQQSVNDRNAKQ